MYSDKRINSEALNNTSIILDKLGESINLNQPSNLSEIAQTKNVVEESIESIIEMKEILLHMTNYMTFGRFMKKNILI